MKYIDWDAEMVHPVDGVDVHAKARSLSVTDLGQVKYIFSDKTGTLTRNEMKLRRVVVRGKCYGLGEKHDEVCQADYGEKDDPLTCKALYDLAQEQGKTDSEAWCARKMVESFMLCNTVIVEQPEEDDDRVHYQAESPDEGPAHRDAGSQDTPAFGSVQGRTVVESKTKCRLSEHDTRRCVPWISQSRHFHS